jgi:hypothetical protein
VIDCDQHLYEYRGLWEEHIDPGLRGEAMCCSDYPHSEGTAFLLRQEQGLPEVRR